MHEPVCEHRVKTPPKQANICRVGKYGGLVTDGMCRLCLRAGEPQPAPLPRTFGPGTELKALLLRWLGIVASPTCPCNAHAAQMDAWGPDECERRLDEIVGWLADEAARRRLPFVRAIAAQVVRIAIRRARNAAVR